MRLPNQLRPTRSELCELSHLLPLKEALDISLRKRSEEQACASGGSFFLVKSRRRLSGDLKDSEELLNSWSSVECSWFSMNI